MSLSVNKNILWLDISMTDAHRVNICNWTQKLICIQLDKYIRYILLLLHIVFHYFIESFWNVLHNYIQIYFIWIVTICIEIMFHLNTVWMTKNFKNLKFTIFIALILINFFYGNMLHDWITFKIKSSNHCLIYDTKTSISYNFFCLV